MSKKLYNERCNELIDSIYNDGTIGRCDRVLVKNSIYFKDKFCVGDEKMVGRVLVTVEEKNNDMYGQKFDTIRSESGMNWLVCWLWNLEKL